MDVRLLPETGTYDITSLYEKCRDCHLFVEPNEASGEGIAPYVHLHRGDEADEALDGSHEPEPSGMIATLTAWQTYGPPEMRERFDTASDYLPADSTDSAD